MIERLLALVARPFLPFTFPQTWGAGGGVYAVEILLVGGGGGGGFNGGGGGGGELSPWRTITVAAGGPYAVTIGAGGAAGIFTGSPAAQNGGDGGPTTFAGLVALGGGGGGVHGSDAYATVGQPGRPGACGGGGGGSRFSGGAGAGGIGSPGYNGGAGLNSSDARDASGGGGGMGGEGLRPLLDGNRHGGVGGPGVWHDASGVAVMYSFGGGAYGSDTYGPNGDGSPSSTPTLANRGAGGSGAFVTQAGGSGLLLLRYLGGRRGTGGAESIVGGYYVHVFNSSGIFTA